MKNRDLVKDNNEKVSFFGPVLKGSLMALSVCLILILIFAFVLRFCSVSDSLIKPINQIIKIKTLKKNNKKI